MYKGMFGHVDAVYDVASLPWQPMSGSSSIENDPEIVAMGLILVNIPNNNALQRVSLTKNKSREFNF